jgi:ATP-dependent RNA helicase DeaD
MERPNFIDLGLSPEVLRAVKDLGFEQASPIQALAIPALLAGRDIFGQSQTGSGKTAAFAIPAIEKVDPSDRSVQVLILCPTRELACQVADEIHKLAAHKNGIAAVPLYGGASYERQFHELRRGVQIVIGTPGRILDHLERGTLRLDSLRTVILDEADRMLDMGFRDDISKILESTPPERQTVFFSATLSPAIRSLVQRYSRGAETLKIEQKELTVPTVEQWVYEIPPRGKFSSLLRLIDYHGYRLGIIFCNTQRMVDQLADDLQAQGISADRLHGGIAQAQRTRVMNKFKKAEFEFLVATDVAGRGIDVDDLEVVVNFDLPYDAEDYVHRIGRTGRAGRHGVAISFVHGREIYKIQAIERFTKLKIRQGTLPTVGEVEERKTDLVLEKLRELLRSGELTASRLLVDRLLEEGFNSTEIAAAAIALQAPTEVRSPEPPPTTAKPVKEKSRPAAPSERSESRPAPTEPPARGDAKSRQVWLQLTAGKAKGLRPPEILALLEDALNLSPRSVGSILLDPAQSFIELKGPIPENLPAHGLKIPCPWGTVKLSLLKGAPPSRPSRPPEKFSKRSRPTNHERFSRKGRR